MYTHVRLICERYQLIDAVCVQHLLGRGGGIFLPEAFYEAADRNGVLLFHDMMFTTTSKTHEPSGSDEEAAELRNAIRRLAHRPSIAIWNSCNECSASGLYVHFVMTLVAAEDASRPIWPGCPSSGWASGVHRLTGLPNGLPLRSAIEVERTLAAGSAVSDTITAPAAAVHGPVSRRALDDADIGLDADTVAADELLVAAPSPTCTFQEGVGYQNPAGGRATPALTKDKCCEKCWADQYCVVGVWVDSTCWMKYDNTGKVHKKGVVSCLTTKTPHPPPKPHRMETHGPYNHGNGWMAVNISPYPRSPPFPTKAPLKLFAANTPISITQQAGVMGVTQPSTFASEFGCSVFSSFESMSATLAPAHWSVHGGGPQADCREPDITNAFWRDCKGVDGAPENVMAERNYPCDPLIIVYLRSQPALSSA